MALNKYLNRTEALNQKYRNNGALAQFQNIKKEQATFDDLIWFYIDPKFARKTRILTGRHGTKGAGNAGLSAENELPAPYSDLIKVFVIETFNTTVSATEKVSRIAGARKLLTMMSGHLYQETVASIVECFSNKDLDRCIHFIRFCEEHGLIPRLTHQLLNNRGKDGRDRTGHERYSDHTKKMADEEVIKAVGAIYSKNFIDISNGVQKPTSVRDLISTFTALLCLAAPNRAAAEVPLLRNQKLQSYSEDSKPKVYYLDWSGSKGYEDNRNHLLRSFAPHIRKGLDYFSKTFQPGRIIASYYSNPNQTLRALLGGFTIEPKRRAYLRLKDKPHLFQLGYSLGFYGVNDKIRVYKNVDSNKYPQHNISGWQLKRISELKVDDLLSASPADKLGMYKLLNCKLRTTSKPIANGLISVGELEKLVFKFQKERNPSFPVAFSTGEAGHVRLEDALFCVLGHQYYVHNGRGSLCGSGYYLLLTPKQLAIQAAYDLSKRGSLFERHGFSPSLFLNLHQLRHYTNTLADKSGIPIEIITAWSGRKRREQTYEYIHTSHADRASRVYDVQIKTHETDRPIRWISSDEVGKELNLPASATSTGICTQNLISNPCEFLNDFVSSCFLCPSACYVAGDKKAMDILVRDHRFQCERLLAVEKDARLVVSTVMKNWFLTHSRNTSILSQLLELMTTAPLGTIISFNEKATQFNLLDVKTKKIEHLSAAIPNTEEDLQKAIERHETSGKEPGEDNLVLKKLLASFNIQENP